jgi:hypothetical protein
MSSVIDAALASPVSTGIAAAVWQAHEEQLQRSKTAQPATVRGVLKVTGSLGGMVFTPFDSEDGDRIYERIDMEKLYAGVQVTLTL